MNKTRWSALVVLALFVVSIIPAVAANGDEVDGNDTKVVTGEATAAKDTKKEITDTKKEITQERYHEAREELKQRAEEQRDALKMKREEARTAHKEQKEEWKARHERVKEEIKVDKERLKEFRTEFKEKRDQIKSEREAARTALGEVRQKIRECAGDKSEECQDARKKARGHSRTFLNRASEHIITVLERARERVEGSEMSADEKAKVLAEIEAAFADVAAAKESSATLGENASKQDIQEVSALIKSSWHESKSIIKKGIGKTASHRIGGVVQKMEHLATKFDRVIARLEKAGKDTGAAKAKKDDYNAKLAAAKKLHEEAKALFEAGNHPAAAEKIRMAHKELKAAHEILKGVVQEIRGIGGGKDLESESGEAAEPAQTPAPSTPATGNETATGVSA